MAPKTAKKILSDILENLSDENLDKFRSELLNRGVVKTSQVQKKGFLVITDVMVQAYTEKNVLKEAEDILRANNCKQAAEELGKNLHNFWTRILKVFVDMDNQTNCRNSFSHRKRSLTG
uniref:Pyrin domain-containing protein n=1 Tax=Poecilia mexicana TaxID=48701 RepID=A0A3B3WQ62_9TELE